MISEWAKEIGIHACRNCRDVVYSELAPNNLLVFLGHCKDMVKRVANASLQRPRSFPLPPEYDFAKGMLFHLPFPLPEEELNVVLKDDLGSKGAAH
jgi:hypothetical protein